jgi:hypothetical protein
LKTTSRYAVFLAAALLAAPLAVSAQARLNAPSFTLGNQALIISAGLFTPLFFQSPEGSFSGTNLSLGGVGSLQWAAYINNFRFYPFEVPLSISAGINFTRLSDHFQILPIMKPGASFYWNYDYEWGFGLNLIWWWTPNVYFGPTPSSSQTRFGNFLEITLSAMYHF